MKKLGVLLLGVLLALPVFADEVPADDAAAEAAPAGEAAPAEAPAEAAVTEEAPAEGSPVEEAPAEAVAEEAPAEAPAEEAPADAVAETPVEETPAEVPVEEAAVAEEAPVEEAPAEEAPVEEVAEEGPPKYIYFGVEGAQMDVSFSSPELKARFGGQDFRSTFYRGRVGTRVFEVVGLEAHFGMSDDDGSEPGRIEVKEYWGVYAVPTSTIFEFFELSVPIGYSVVKLARGNAEAESGRVSFGLNAELPLKSLSESLPDLRIGAGGLVYQAENHARLYGYHAGIRYDFKF